MIHRSVMIHKNNNIGLHTPEIQKTTNAKIHHQYVTCMNDKGAFLVELNQNNEWTFPSASDNCFTLYLTNKDEYTIKMNNGDEILVYKNLNLDKLLQKNPENVGFVTWTGHYIIVKDIHGMFAKFADSFPAGHMMMYLKLFNLIKPTDNTNQ